VLVDDVFDLDREMFSPPEMMMSLEGALMMTQPCSPSTPRSPV